MSTPTAQPPASHEADVAALNAHGYAQKLNRSLGSFSSFAAGFSYISILTGMFQLFGFGYGFGGPLDVLVLDHRPGRPVLRRARCSPS